MKMRACLLFLFFNLQILAAEIAPIAWHGIQIDGGEIVFPEGQSAYSLNKEKLFMALQTEHGFTPDESLEIMAGVYRGGRITYVNATGEILPLKKSHEEKKSKCTIT